MRCISNYGKQMLKNKGIVRLIKTLGSIIFVLDYILVWININKQLIQYLQAYKKKYFLARLNYDMCSVRAEKQIVTVPVSATFLIVCLNAQMTESKINLNCSDGILRKAVNKK